MKTKNLFKLFFAGVVVISMAACKKEQEVKGYDVAKFAVEASEVTATTATVKVSVTENDSAPWYGILTDDLESDIKDIVSGMSANIKASVLMVGNKSLPFENLIPGGYTYRYVVSGFAADGRNYGEPVEVLFSTSADYSVNSNWIISYLGTLLYRGEYVTYLSFDGIEEGEYFNYLIVSEEEYNEIGVEKIIAADVQSVITNEEVEDSLLDEGGEYLWEALDPGKYYVIMYGVDKNYSPTQKYAAQSITVEGSSDKYKAYLGTWYSETGDQYVIGEDIINESYTITGFFGTNPVPAYLNAAGQMEIYAYQLGVSGGYAYRLLGLDQDEYIETGDENGLLAVGAVSEDGSTLNIIGNEYQAVYGGTTYDEIISALTIFRYGPDPDNEGTNRYFSVSGASTLVLPAGLSTKVPAATEEYSAWLGTWYDENVNEFTFTEGIINNSFILTGFDEDNEFEVEVAFDKETGEIGILYQDIEESASSTYDFSFLGVTDDGYLSAGDSNNILAVGKLSSDKSSFTLEGVSYVNSSNVQNTVVEIGIFGYNGGYYSFYDLLYISLPTEFTRDLPIASDAFKAWVGNWEIERGSQKDIISIAENKVNSSYTVTGIEGTPFEVIATFDKETGSLSIAEQTVYELADDNDKNIFTVALYGNFIYNGNTYYWGGANTPVLFTATIGDDGNAEMVAGCPYEPYIPYYGYFTSYRLYSFIGEKTSPTSYSTEDTSLPNVMKPVEEDATTSTAALNASNWQPVSVKSLSKSSLNDAGDNKKDGAKKVGDSVDKKDSKAYKTKAEGSSFQNGSPAKKQDSQKKGAKSELRGTKVK